MLRETLIPKSEADWLQKRAIDLTSTEVPALFNLSPYATPFELFHRKKDAQLVDFVSNDRVLWGQRLESAIAAGVAQDLNVEIRPMKEYMRVPEHRLGASFDFAIGDDGILEIKNVDSLAFRDGWLVDEDDNVEAPPHIELQVQTQLLVSGRKFVKIGALIGGNRVVVIHREPDEFIAEQILHHTKLFWESIVKDEAPPMDYLRDADMLSKIYGYAEPGKIFDAKSSTRMTELAMKYRSLGEQAKEIEASRTMIKAEFLKEIGDAEKVVGDGYTISTSQVAPTLVPSFERRGFRGFRLSVPRSKKDVTA